MSKILFFTMQFSILVSHGSLVSLTVSFDLREDLISLLDLVSCVLSLSSINIVSHKQKAINERVISMGGS
jgi:hypothetical protein